MAGALEFLALPVNSPDLHHLSSTPGSAVYNSYPQTAFVITLSTGWLLPPDRRTTGMIVQICSRSNVALKTLCEGKDQIELNLFFELLPRMLLSW